MKLLALVLLSSATLCWAYPQSDPNAAAVTPGYYPIDRQKLQEILDVWNKLKAAKLKLDEYEEREVFPGSASGSRGMADGDDEKMNNGVSIVLNLMNQLMEMIMQSGALGMGG